MNTPSLSEAAGTEVSITQPLCIPTGSSTGMSLEPQVGMLGILGMLGGLLPGTGTTLGPGGLGVSRFGGYNSSGSRSRGWEVTWGGDTPRGVARGAWLTCMQQLSMIMVSNLILG